jgi:hypothetical protein
VYGGRQQPPYTYPGGSMIVDYDGRPLAQAEYGAGEKLVFAPLDVESLRQARQARRGHHFLAQLRTEAYGGYAKPIYPPAGGVPGLQENERGIEQGKRRLG